jgi:hypothetical protein
LAGKVEESYEEILRGIKGVNIFKDKYNNREIGSYKMGNMILLQYKEKT